MARTWYLVTATAMVAGVQHGRAWADLLPLWLPRAARRYGCTLGAVMAFTEELSAAIRSSSQRLARLPLVGALQAGTLPVESCVGLFDALAVIRGAWRRQR